MREKVELLDGQERVSHSLEILRRLRDEWSDEIPDELINGMSDNKMSKVRGNWFQGVVVHSTALLEVVDARSQEIDEIMEIIDYFCNSEEFRRKMATRVDSTDIQKGNDLFG